jgi:8-oxo-dGTP diphosphatase
MSSRNEDRLRKQIRDEVSSIRACDSTEADELTATLQWIDSGDELCRLVKPAHPPRHLVSYFPCTDGSRLLLVDHRNAELWLPTGGHVEPGEHPHATVQREAREELGIDAHFMFASPVMLTIAETQGFSAGHTDVSLWYVLRLEPGAILRPDFSEFSDACWFAFDDVPYGRTDPNMKRFVSKLKSMLR